MIEFLLSIDYLSANETLRINSKTRFQSVIGGILSLLSITFSSIMALYLTQSFLFHKEPNITHSINLYEFNDNFILDKGQLEFFFGMEFPNSTYYMDETIYTISSVLMKVDFYIKDDKLKSNVSEIPLEIKKCSEYYKIEEIKNFNIQFPHDLFYCIKPGQAQIGGFWGGKFFNSVKVYISKCKNSTSTKKCRPIEEINSYIEQGFVNVFATDVLLDQKDFFKPVKLYLKDIFQRVSYKSSLNYLLLYNEFDFTTDEGNIFEDLQTWKFGKILDVKTSYNFNLNSQSIYDPFGDLISFFQLETNNYRENYIRTYPKIQDVLTRIGGFIKSLNILGYLLYSIYFRPFKIIDFIFQNHSGSLEHILKNNETYMNRYFVIKNFDIKELIMKKSDSKNHKKNLENKSIRDIPFNKEQKSHKMNLKSKTPKSNLMSNPSVVSNFNLMKFRNEKKKFDSDLKKGDFFKNIEEHYTNKIPINSEIEILNTDNILNLNKIEFLQKEKFNFFTNNNSNVKIAGEKKDIQLDLCDWSNKEKNPNKEYTFEKIGDSLIKKNPDDEHKKRNSLFKNNKKYIREKRNKQEEMKNENKFIKKDAKSHRVLRSIYLNDEDKEYNSYSPLSNLADKKLYNEKEQKFDYNVNIISSLNDNNVINDDFFIHTQYKNDFNTKFMEKHTYNKMQLNKSHEKHKSNNVFHSNNQKFSKNNSPEEINKSVENSMYNNRNFNVSNNYKILEKRKERISFINSKILNNSNKIKLNMLYDYWCNSKRKHSIGQSLKKQEKLINYLMSIENIYKITYESKFLKYFLLERDLTKIFDRVFDYLLIDDFRINEFRDFIFYEKDNSMYDVFNGESDKKDESVRKLMNNIISDFK